MFKVEPTDILKYEWKVEEIDKLIGILIFQGEKGDVQGQTNWYFEIWMKSRRNGLINRDFYFSGWEGWCSRSNQLIFWNMNEK